MEFLNSLRKAVGIKTLEERFLETTPDKRAKLAAKALKNENNADNAEALKSIKESRRIYEMQNVTPAQKLRLPETKDLRYKDGTVWLNLVLALYEQDKSIVAEVLDLPAEVRQVLAGEMAKREGMPAAKQRMLDAAQFVIKEKAIFNVAPMPANDNDPARLEKAA